MEQDKDLAALIQQAEEAAFIGIQAVKRISGFSKSTLLRKIKAKKFPEPVIAEGNCTRWCLREVMAWRAAQFKAREQRMDEQPQSEAVA
jgi:predicted DNA-binding transcriptional regulator AlpA